MDTLIYIPFSIWGLNPFVSKNLNYVFERPKIKEIEIYKSYDYGLVLRKDLIKADSLPISTMYSIQFPNDNYSQYGIGFSRFLYNFLLSFNYDYNNSFKQGSFSLDYKNANFSYFEIFKLQEHLQFFYIGYSKFLSLNYQLFNDTPLIFIKLLKSKFIYSDNQRELFLNYGLERNHFSLNGGIYHNFLFNFTHPNYELSIKFNFLNISSKYEPFQFDTIYIKQKHSFNISYKFFNLGYSYELNLIPIDTSKFSYSHFHSLSFYINSKFFKFYALRNIKIPIEWIIKLYGFYDYYPRKDILIKPYISATYIENEFDIKIEDIFISTFGVSFYLFNGIYVDFNYSSNLMIKSLWNYNSYGLFLRISMED